MGPSFQAQRTVTRRGPSLLVQYILAQSLAGGGRKGTTTTPSQSPNRREGMGGTCRDGGGGEAMVEPTPEAAAAEEVAARFRSLVDPDDIASIRQTQHLILGRLQDSNAVLSHFNEYSEQCFAEVSSDFVNKTRLLKSMKADLDHIFTKLRGMKARLAATYPDAFPDGAMSKTMDQRPDLESPLD